MCELCDPSGPLHQGEGEAEGEGEGEGLGLRVEVRVTVKLRGWGEGGGDVHGWTETEGFSIYQSLAKQLSTFFSTTKVIYSAHIYLNPHLTCGKLE